VETPIQLPKTRIRFTMAPAVPPRPGKRSLRQAGAGQQDAGKHGTTR